VYRKPGEGPGPSIPTFSPRTLRFNHRREPSIEGASNVLRPVQPLEGGRRGPSSRATVRERAEAPVSPRPGVIRAEGRPPARGRPDRVDRPRGRCGWGIGILSLWATNREYRGLVTWGATGYFTLLDPRCSVTCLYATSRGQMYRWRVVGRLYCLNGGGAL